MDTRLTFQEVLRLIPLPFEDGKTVKRYMSTRAAWLPGADIIASDEVPTALRTVFVNRNAFGAHVYSQAGLAAVALVQESGIVRSQDIGKYGIHTIHGYWSEAGRVDRPFIYEVTPLATSHLFINVLVTARQPTLPSLSGSGDHYIPADAEQPLGKICFSGIVSFRPPEKTLHRHQEPSVQSRFASILTSRRAEDWIPAPALDIDRFTEAIPRSFVGTFPILDMKKVDMRAFNAGKPIQERRELLLYRLLAPLAADDPSAHVMAHAYETDRNGFLMFVNHAGWGHEFGRAASLSNSIVVHTNPADAVMRGDGWWVQEVIMARSDAGRGLLYSKVWSPEGIHVLTCYQDGIFRPAKLGGGKKAAAKL